jgi:cytochrome c oxidase subunit 2
MNKGLAALCAVFVAVATVATGRYFWDFGFYPHATGSSTIAPAVDTLYLVISYVTTGMFFLVWSLLIGFMVIYRRRPGAKSHYSHGNMKAEVIWTIIPAAMLVGLAFGQIPTWAKAKQDFPKPNEVDKETNEPPVVIQIIAQQYDWNFRYRPEDNTADFKRGIDPADSSVTDYKIEEAVHPGPMVVPCGRKVFITQTSMDVIHSLFLPYMRVKQDAVPGMYVRVWFQPTRFRVVELPEKFEDWNRTDWDKRIAWTNEKDFGKAYGDKRVAFRGIEFMVEKYWENPDTKLTEVMKKLMTKPAKVDIIQNDKVEWDVPLADTARRPTHAVIPFDLACAELCGAGHHTMKKTLWVGTETMYRAWLGKESENATPAIWKRWVERKPSW